MLPNPADFFYLPRLQSCFYLRKAYVLAYGPFSLWVMHKEGLCPSSGDINRLMMMMKEGLDTATPGLTTQPGPTA
jgi:hypothetical protein